MPKNKKKREPIPALQAFASRVVVLNSKGEYLYRAHPEEAQALCRTNTVVPVKGDGRISKVQLVRFPGRPAQGTATGNALYRPQDAIPIRVEGRKTASFQLKPIRRSDKWAVNKVYQDCIKEPSNV